MTNTLIVNDQELMIKEYEAQRVVHMWDIARLHGVPTKNIRTNFENNRKYLVEGEDYFLVEKTEEFADNLIVSKDISKKALGPAKNIPVFTESGYLMMVKPMTDEISWQVQRQLVNCYFKVKEVVREAEEKEVKPEIKSLADVNKTIELLTGMYDRMMVSNEDKLNTVKTLLETAGLQLPYVEIPNVVDKSNYISIRELAKKIGIYDRYSRPNIEAVAAVMDIIKLDNDEFKATMSLDTDNNDTYKMVFSPALVKKVSQWLSERDYPQFLERELNNGDIKRILVVYRDKDFHVHKK